MASTDRVRAAVLVKPRTLEARAFAPPTIGLDDALLRIEACGLCGSDYEQYEGALLPHEDYTPFPVIPGHEPLGVIVADPRCWGPRRERCQARARAPRQRARRRDRRSWRAPLTSSPSQGRARRRAG